MFDISESHINSGNYGIVVLHLKIDDGLEISISISIPSASISMKQEVAPVYSFSKSEAVVKSQPYVDIYANLDKEALLTLTKELGIVQSSPPSTVPVEIDLSPNRKYSFNKKGE